MHVSSGRPTKCLSISLVSVVFNDDLSSVAVLLSCCLSGWSVVRFVSCLGLLGTAIGWLLLRVAEDKCSIVCDVIYVPNAQSRIVGYRIQLSTSDLIITLLN